MVEKFPLKILKKLKFELKIKTSKVRLEKSQKFLDFYHKIQYTRRKFELNSLKTT